ncbi:MAG TPA: Na+/H+ antiporter [Rubrobacteraceae bacterium]|jgi:CPA1 family monovalent cation:H+ antiporter|nr:Na+/H+ antiporter [Rubrobacteraceae bacterium]
MEHLGIVIVGLLVAVAGLALLARLLHIPYPIFLVIGGLAIGFLPGVPKIELPPDMVLLIFLPPLLYAAAFFTSLRDLRANVRPISLLAIGLVVTTTLSVAAAAHWVIGFSWPVAFVLGAIVSPTDAVAPATIVRRLGVPRRVITIIEGENLTNDWTALVFYRFAVAAVVSGTFSLWEAGVRFLLAGLGGLAIGLLIGWLIANVRRRIEDSMIEITISLFTGYAAYLTAEEIGASGVIAAVTAGIYLGWNSPTLTSPSTRIQAFSVWELLQFLLNAVLFVLIGLQLPNVLEGISGREAGTLLWWGLAVSAVVIVTRLVWVFVLTYLPRFLSRQLLKRDPYPGWRNISLLAWSGMRGAVSLAAALAIPFTTASDSPFPERDLIIFLTFCVILATLVLQGLSLPALIRVLKVEDDGTGEKEETKARLKIAQAAVARIDELALEEWVREDTAERMRGLYDYRRRRFAARLGVADEDGRGEDYEERSGAFMRLQREVFWAEREELVRLRNEGKINDEVMHRVERDLDLEESRLEE